MPDDVEISGRQSVPEGPTLVASIRTRLGVESVRDFMSRAGELNVEGVFEKAYEDWLRHGAGPPVKPQGELRPCHCPSSISRINEASFVFRGMLMADSVALVLPAGSYLYLKLVPLLLACEELIDSGLLVLIPERLVESRTTAMSHLLEFSTQVAAGSYHVDRGRAVSDLEIAQSLDACSSLEGYVDLGLTDRRQSRVLLDHFAEVQRLQQASTHDELRFLPDLLEIDLPVVNLPVKDLLVLRKDGYMAGFRALVRDATQAAMTADPDLLLDRQSTLRLEFQERVRWFLEEDMSARRKSGVLRAATGGSATFGVGVATGALGGAGGPAVGAAAGGLSVVGAALVEWFTARTSKGHRAQRRLLSTISTPVRNEA